MTPQGPDPRIHELPCFLTPAECETLIARCAALGFQSAPVRLDSGTVNKPGIRDNSRVEFTDMELAAALFSRLLNFCPAEAMMAMAGQAQRPLGLRSWFRGYRYEPSQHFGKHRDKFEPAEGGISRITLLIYLNEPPPGTGATVFHPERGSLAAPRRVEPKLGGTLLFASELLHEGERLESGVKLVLRSDILFPLAA